MVVPNVDERTPLSFHRMIEVSSDAEASVSPLGEKRTALTGYKERSGNALRSVCEASMRQLSCAARRPRDRDSSAHLRVAVELLLEEDLRVFVGLDLDLPKAHLVVISGGGDEPRTRHINTEHGLAPMPRNLWRLCPRHGVVRRAAKAG
eukprot:scaffold197923_cov36-Tisochrysis_lutea.AAC.1